MLLNFLVYVTLPVFLKYIGILFGIGSFTIYMSAIIGMTRKDSFFWEQVQSYDVYFIHENLNIIEYEYDNTYFSKYSAFIE